MSAKEFTRKELYDLVWSKPLLTLSKEYNISDNGLRKICKKYAIALPKGGHWQKVQFNKKTVQLPYVYEEKWKDAKIKLTEKEEEGEDHYLTQLARLTKEISEKHSKLLVAPERLVNADPLVQRAKEYLDKQKSSSWQPTVYTGDDLLSINVTKNNVPRALRFMDMFVKLAKARGHNIEFRYRETLIVVDNESYEIRLREKHNRGIVQETNWTRSVLIPNGILSLKYGPSCSHIEWKDGKILLEQQLARIIASFEIRAKNDKIERAKHEARREEQKRIEAIKKKEAAMQAWEIKKQTILLQHSEQWHKAQQLKLFLEEIEKRNVSSDEKMLQWIQWGKDQLKLLNPLSNGLDSLIAQYEFQDN